MKSYMNESNKFFIQFVKDNIVQILSVCILALGAYISYRFAPIATNIALLSQKVSAIEEENKKQVSSEEFKTVYTQLQEIQHTVNQILLK